MRMYWNEFWAAVEGQSNDVIVAYQRAMSYQYHHNHGKSLKDDDEFLRRICRTEKSEWHEVRDVIFSNDKFFIQDEDGDWYQKRVLEEWQNAEIDYSKAVAGGKKRWGGTTKAERAESARLAAIERWKGHASPNAKAPRRSLA